jgi:hypothetical protein
MHHNLHATGKLPVFLVIHISKNSLFCYLKYNVDFLKNRSKSHAGGCPAHELQKSPVSQKRCSDTQSAHSSYDGTMTAISGRPLAKPTSRRYQWYNPSASVLSLTHFGKLATKKFARIWRYIFSLTTSEY